MGDLCNHGWPATRKVSDKCPICTLGASLSAENERLRAQIAYGTALVAAVEAALSPTAGREVVCVPQLRALVALADAAEALHEKHAIIQPFFAIYKEHEDAIAEARALLGPRTEGE